MSFCASEIYVKRPRAAKAPAFFFEKVVNSATVLFLLMIKDVASHSLVMHSSSIDPFGAGQAKGRTGTVKLQPRGFLYKNGVTTAPAN